MHRTAFELRSEYAGTVEVELDGEKSETPVFVGGVVAIPPEGTAFDIREALEEGGGKIVVDDSNPTLLEILRNYPALKETSVPDGSDPVSGYGHLNRAGLLELAQRRGLEGAGSKSKAELVELLERQDDAVAEGDQERADAPEEG